MKETFPDMADNTKERHDINCEMDGFINILSYLISSAVANWSRHEDGVMLFKDVMRGIRI